MLPHKDPNPYAKWRQKNAINRKKMHLRLLFSIDILIEKYRFTITYKIKTVKNKFMNNGTNRLIKSNPINPSMKNKGSRCRKENALTPNLRG